MKLKNKKLEKKFALPTEFSEPLRELADYSLLIFGAAGVGKTTLTQQFPNPLHVMTETGGKALRLKAVYPESTEAAIRYLKKFAESSFQTGVLDTVEAFRDMAYKEAQEDGGWEHPSEEAYGKGWDAVNVRFFKFLKQFLRLKDKGAILLSHAVRGTRKLAGGDEVEDIHPNLSGKTLSEVMGMVDVVGYYYAGDDQNYLQIRPSMDVAAKCRLEENFLYTDGTPVRTIPMGNSKQEAYQNLVSAFNNELEKPEERRVKKAKLKKRKK